MAPVPPALRQATRSIDPTLRMGEAEEGRYVPPLESVVDAAHDCYVLLGHGAVYFDRALTNL